MKTVYLNWKGPKGRETVDEFTKEPSESLKTFRDYVRKMCAEYFAAGMNVYRSSRPCKGWKD